MKVLKISPHEDGAFMVTHGKPDALGRFRIVVQDHRLRHPAGKQNIPHRVPGFLVCFIIHFNRL